MKTKTQIKTLIEEAKQGKICTEQESATIKTYIKETILMVGNGSIDIDQQLQSYFPIEWAEAQDEINGYEEDEDEDDFGLHLLLP